MDGWIRGCVTMCLIVMGLEMALYTVFGLLEVVGFLFFRNFVVGRRVVVNICVLQWRLDTLPITLFSS